MKSYLNVCRLAGIALFMSTQSVALAAPDSVKIKNLTVNGSGCPQGSVQRSLAADKKSFTLQFSDYIAEFSRHLPRGEARKFCQLTLQLKVPDGWRFAVASFQYRGFLELDEALRAKHQTTYYFQGQGRTESFSQEMQGPQIRDFYFSESVEAPRRFWSPCASKRAINIKTSLKIQPRSGFNDPDAEGIMGTDVVSGQLARQEWRLEWQRCD